MVTTHPFDCPNDANFASAPNSSYYRHAKISSKETTCRFPSMALQSRPLAQPTRGDVPVRSETDASAALPRLRHAGFGRHGNEMPPVRREHEVFIRRGEQASDLDAADLPVTYAMLTICWLMFGLSMIFLRECGVPPRTVESPGLVNEPRRISGRHLHAGDSLPGRILNTLGLILQFFARRHFAHRIQHVVLRHRPIW